MGESRAPQDTPVAALPVTVGGVVADIFRHPRGHVLRNWNWKAALISLALRGSIFFAVNLTASWASAAHALATELLYRAPLAGTLAAISQSFRRVQPAWAGAVVVMVALPAVAHAIEFGAHWWRGTERLVASVAVSVGFSMLTAVSTYLLQRRGILVVGAGSQPFLTDVWQAPQALLELTIRRPAGLARRILAKSPPGGPRRAENGGD